MVNSLQAEIIEDLWDNWHTLCTLKEAYYGKNIAVLTLGFLWLVMSWTGGSSALRHLSWPCTQDTAYLQGD